MADEVTQQESPSTRAKPTLKAVKDQDKTVRLVTEVVAVYETVEDAMAAYDSQYAGSDSEDLHTVKVTQGNKVLSSKSWKYFLDEKGHREVKSLSRTE